MHYPYKHVKPEAETRVLKIAPNKGGVDAPIVCSLVHTSLASPIPYEALSYVWGNSVTGFLNDADPEQEIAGWMRNAAGISKTITTGKIKDFVNQPEFQSVLFGQGYPRPKGTITIDGVKVEVGGELYAALRRLRSHWEGQELAVWIDALCINQDDIQERNEHVKSMREIYQGAETVRIWLGETLSDADRVAFEILSKVSNFLDKRFEAGDFEDHWLMKQKFFDDLEMRNLNWDCLSAVLSRAWFRRTWVIQEVGLANSATIHLGAHCCDWEFLASIITTLRRFDMDIMLWTRTEFTAHITISLMDKLQTRRRKSAQEKVEEHPITLLQILHESRDFKCTNLRDKIYGVLGLADDRNAYQAPDYSLPVSDIFASVATSHIENSQGLTILYHCSSGSESSGLSMPSWIPDWTGKCYHTPFYLTSLKFQASGFSPASCRFSGTVLIVRGRVVEKILCVDHVRNVPRNADQSPKHDRTITTTGGDEMKMWGSPDLFCTNAKKWIHRHTENQRDYVNNIMRIAFPDKVVTAEAFEALWRTFVCNQTDDGKVPPTSWGVQFSRFVARMRSCENEKGDVMEDILRASNGPAITRNSAIRKWDLTESFERFSRKELDEYRRFLNANGTWCCNRRFFKTDAGRFGWAPDGVHEGDIVAIIDGMDVPLVLRPADEGYEVIGDCYAHGLMLGEVMNMGIECIEIRLV